VNGNADTQACRDRRHGHDPGTIVASLFEVMLERHGAVVIDLRRQIGDGLRVEIGFLLLPPTS